MPKNSHEPVNSQQHENRAQAPESPAHLDDAILAYAREEGARLQSRNRKRVVFGVGRWFDQPWRSGLAVFSVACIAVAISLQDFRAPDDDRTLSEAMPLDENVVSSDLASNNSLEQGELAVSESTPEPTPEPGFEPSSASLSTSLSAPVPEAVLEAPTVAEVDAEVEVEALADGDTEPAIDTAEEAATESRLRVVSIEQQRTAAEADSAQPARSPDLSSDQLSDRPEPVPATTAGSVASTPVQPESAEDNAEIEEVIVTGASVRSRAFEAASPATVADQRPPLGPALAENPQLQTQFILLLSEVFQQTVDEPPVEAEEKDRQAARLLEAFNSIPELAAIVELGNRYGEARDSLPPYTLPANLQAAMELLESIEFQ